MTDKVVRKLFPVLTDEDARRDPLNGIEYPTPLPTENQDEWTVTECEVKEALSRMKTNKTSSWNSVPALVTKGLRNYDTRRLLAFINSIMERGEFPESWRTS